MTFGSGLALAEEEEEMATDRPDFVESADVVGKGHFQLETSISYERDRNNGVKTRLVSMPTLLRFGVGENWEARIETDGRQVLRVEQGTTRETVAGYADTSLGVKWQIQKGKDSKPTVALLAHADLDSGSGAFRGDGIRPSLRLVAEWEFANEIGLGVQPGITADKNSDGKRFYAGQFGVVLGKNWTPKWRTYVELAVQQIARSKDGGNVVSFDFGSAYQLTKNTQIDIGVQRGLNRNTPDWTVGTGFSIKF
jgi:hypothetical protein